MGQIPFFPVEASTFAGPTDLLMVGLIALSSFFVLIVVVLITYFALKYRKGKPADRRNPPAGNTKMELGWIFGLLILSAGVFVWASVLYIRIYSPPTDAMEVFVVGKQWMWKFQHQEGQKEINELHVPLGRPVRLLMTSQDVIHSFYVPAFRVKRDVIPGRYSTMWFQATRPGEYHLFCAEYCGTNHSLMGGTIVVMEPRDYETWLSGSTVSVPLATAGAQLFQQLGCSSCHAQGAGVRAPSLQGLFGQPVPLQSGGTVIADENYIRESIFFPQKKVVAGYEPIMPTYEGRITEEQVLQLIAYIKSIGEAPAGGAQPTAQPGAATPGAGGLTQTPAVTQPAVPVTSTPGSQP
jgi:cytochrome c oxidase subunit 2